MGDHLPESLNPRRKFPLGLDATESVFYDAAYLEVPPEERENLVGEMLHLDGEVVGICVAVWRSPQGVDAVELDPARHPADVEGWEQLA